MATKQNTQKKTFIIDTNVLLYDAKSITAFKDNTVIIPIVVLTEIDKHKDRQDEAGFNARQAVRDLDVLCESGKLSAGVKLENGGLLVVDNTSAEETYADDVIIKIAIKLKEKNPIVVTKDINLRVKCNARGIKCEDYTKHHLVKDVDSIYTGVRRFDVTPEIIVDFYKQQSIQASVLNAQGLSANEFIIMKDPLSQSSSAIGIYKKETGEIKRVIDNKDVFGLKPKNKEQNFALNLLLDDKIKLVSLLGAAGTGKTLLAVAAGIELTFEKKLYDRMLVMRSVCPVGRDIGFLPGTLEEKMEPWVAPIKDNLSFLFTRENGEPDPLLDMLYEKKIIEVEAMAFIRGRSIPRSFIIVDEAQNLTAHELKTIVTRVGEGSKLILTGDIEQIDNVYVDSISNGLTYAVQKFREYPIAGHISLIKGERSELATLAAQIL